MAIDSGQFGIGEQSLSFGGGIMQVIDAAYGNIQSHSLNVPEAKVSAAELELTITLPPNSIVLSAEMTVKADPAGNTPIGNVAQVRAAAGDPNAASNELVVDFGGMRTVSAVTLGSAIAVQEVRPWMGMQFAPDQPAGITSFGLTGKGFPEVQTERLLLKLSNSVAPDYAMANGTVIVSTPPADLELLVEGARAWFRPGAAPPAFSQDVPIGDALQAAVDASRVGTGSTDLELRLLLRSRVACQLSLVSPQPISYLQTHLVVFPEGPSRTFEIAEEGVLTVALPLPTEAKDWLVQRVEALVQGESGPERVLPPTGPDPSTAAVLALDSEHSAVVGLPTGRLKQYAELTALRVLITPGATGAELGGVLRTDIADHPGDPIPAATLGPVQLPPGQGTSPVPAWVTIPLSKPIEIRGEDPKIWASIQCSRGQVLWPVAQGTAGPSSTESMGRLRRQMPNGSYRALSGAGGVNNDAAMIRVVGEPPIEAAIPLLEGGIVGQQPSAFSPNKDGVGLKLGAKPPGVGVEPDESGAASFFLSFTSKAPARITLGPVTVAYSLKGA
jgi:hypothetical protein